MEIKLDIKLKSMKNLIKMKKALIISFVILFAFAYFANNHSYAQYPSPAALNAKDLIKILNTDDKSTVVQFLRSYGFMYVNTNFAGEHYVYHDKGKMSTDYGLGCVILGKSSTQMNRQVFYVTPYVSATNNLMSDLEQLHFKTFASGYEHDYPIGSYIIEPYNARFITIYSYDHETSERVYYSSLSMINKSKIPWK